MMILFQICLIYVLQSSKVANTATNYRFGIEKKFFDLTLNINDTFPDYLTKILKVTFDYVPINAIKDNFENLDKQKQAINDISNKKLDAFLGTSSSSNFIITNALKIPMFIIDKIDHIYQSPFNVFNLCFDENDFASLTLKMINFVRTQKSHLNFFQQQDSKLADLKKIIIQSGGSFTERLLISENETVQTLQKSIADKKKFLYPSLPIDIFNIFNSEPFQAKEKFEILLESALLNGILDEEQTWIMFYLADLNSNVSATFDRYLNTKTKFVYFQYDYRNLLVNQTITTKEQVIQCRIFDSVNFLLANLPLAKGKSSDERISILKTGTLQTSCLAENLTFISRTGKFFGEKILIKKVVMKPNEANEIGEYIYDKLTIFQTKTVSLSSKSYKIKIGMELTLAIFEYSLIKGEFQGFSMDVIKYLQAITPFNYQLIVSLANFNKFNWTTDNNPFINNDLVTLSTKDLTELFKDGDIDMSLMPLTFIPDEMKSQVVLSESVYDNNINAVFTVDDDQFDFLFYLKPFTLTSWFAIIIAYLLFGCIIWLINKISPNDKFEMMSNSEDEYKLTFLNSMLWVFTTAMMYRLKLIPDRISMRLCFTTIWMFSLLLIIKYGIVIFINFCNPLPYLEVRDVYDLNKSELRGNIKWSFVANSSELNYLRTTSPFSDLYRLAELNWPGDMFFEREGLDEQFMKTKNRVLIQQSMQNNLIYYKHCKVIIYDDVIDTLTSHFTIKIGWVFTDEMLKMIQKIIENGSIRLLVGIYFGNGYCVRDYVSLPNVSIPYFQQLISLFIGGLGFITLILLIMMFSKLSKMLKRAIKLKKLPNFQFGKKYAAFVHSVENTGAWLFLNKRKRPYFINETQLCRDSDMNIKMDQLDIHEGDTITMSYFGKDPLTKLKRFFRA